MSGQPNPNGCELDEGKVVRGEFIIPSGDAPALFNPVEEVLDQITRPIKVWAKQIGFCDFASEEC
jgi:hypothetical protein